MYECAERIHTQEQAQAELERHRRLARARYGRERQRLAASDQDTTHCRKRKRIDDGLLYVDNMTDANTVARMRQTQKEKNSERCAEERADILNRIQQRFHRVQAFH